MTLHLVFPRSGDVDAVDLYTAPVRPVPAHRPWVAVNMIASLDGSTVLDGRAGPLGGAADRTVLRVLRSVADVVLVGSGTWTAESYGPPRLGPDLQSARVARGQEPQPRIGIVTGRLGIDLTAEFFTATPTRPLILTAPTAAPGRRDAAAAVAEVIVAGDESGGVDVSEVLRRLRAAEVGVVLCEGGPTLNADLVSAGVVDEICLTISSLVVGGVGQRIFGAADIAEPQPFDLAHVAEADGMLFCRYVRAGALGDASAAGGVPDAE